MMDGPWVSRDEELEVVRRGYRSLNSLFEMIRQAQPLYTECSSILNNVEDVEDVELKTIMQEQINDLRARKANKDADFTRLKHLKEQI
jgi:hypothetical protein